jgi:hypothetical protein
MTQDKVVSFAERVAEREPEKVFNMIEALGAELQRQGVAEILTTQGFDLTSLARAALRVTA